ncbi:CPBP family intramembrane glutamic endopeptidase [Psychrobacter ciconiae]|uniref:CPBP family intramembrane glutamic endopeptidase n=1 Tax=Psychrobacter ciconiae TaxID=1553449 RepID=UPI00191B0C53|nr:CPBP family intramembrane glutamic endopeptidase [Psychrobacter ciconiae]
MSDAPSTSNIAPSKPLFSRFGVVGLMVVTVILFFVTQTASVFLAGKWLLVNADYLAWDDVLFLGSSNGTVVSASIIISALILSLLIWLILKLKKQSVGDYLVLKPFNLKVAIAMIGILLLFMIGSQALTYLLDKEPLDFVNPLFSSVNSVWLLVFVMVVVAPIYEELVFRGLLWSAIAEQFEAPRGLIIASLVTSIIFALIHLQYGIYEMSTIVILALIFCWARIKSGSLLLPMLLHIINNGAAMLQYLQQAS